MNPLEVDDVLDLIFLNLNRKSLLTVSLVSQQWSRCVSTRLLALENIDLQSGTIDPDLPQIFLDGRDFTSAYLDFDSLRASPRWVFENLARKSREITSLNISDLSFCTFRSILLELKCHGFSLSSLNTLDGEFSSWSASSLMKLIKRYFPNLKVLIHSSCLENKLSISPPFKIPSNSSIEHIIFCSHFSYSDNTFDAFYLILACRKVKSVAFQLPGRIPTVSVVDMISKTRISQLVLECSSKMLSCNLESVTSLTLICIDSLRFAFDLLKANPQIKTLTVRAVFERPSDFPFLQLFELVNLKALHFIMGDFILERLKDKSLLILYKHLSSLTFKPSLSLTRNDPIEFIDQLNN